MCYNINVPKGYRKNFSRLKRQKWRCKLMEKMFSFTKREGFSKIASILANAGESELEQFVQHEIELLAKKSSKKVNPDMEKNLVKVYGYLKALNAPVTVKDIITAYNCNPVEMSSARMTNLLMKLCDEGKVTREKVKGAYRYSITDIEE